MAALALAALTLLLAVLLVQLARTHADGDALLLVAGLTWVSWRCLRLSLGIRRKR